MSATSSTDSWQTADDLAAEWGTSPRWVRDRMADGSIPSVKVGRRRFFTPECRARLVAEQVTTEPDREQTAAKSWGRATRSTRTA